MFHFRGYGPPQRHECTSKTHFPLCSSRFCIFAPLPCHGSPLLLPVPTAPARTRSFQKACHGVRRVINCIQRDDSPLFTAKCHKKKLGHATQPLLQGQDMHAFDSLTSSTRSYSVPT